VEVRDGPELAALTKTGNLNVGWTGVEGEVDVEGEFVREGLAGERESLTVRCAATVLSGSTATSPARARAYGIMGLAGAALTQNQQLGGLVMDARIGTHSLNLEQTSPGAQATVVFEVVCDTYAAR
jgi:hypothetical protein